MRLKMRLKDVSVLNTLPNIVFTIKCDFEGQVLSPCLKAGKKYFLNTAYLDAKTFTFAAKGLYSFFSENKGEMKLIVSDQLEEAEYFAIAKGIKNKEQDVDKYIESLFMKVLNEGDEQEKTSLALLTSLVQSGKLEVKVCISKNDAYGLSHTKFGIIEDSHGDKVLFHGSLNFTRQAMKSHSEQIGFAKSWADLATVEQSEDMLNELWSGHVSEDSRLQYYTIPAEKHLLKIAEQNPILKKYLQPDIFESEIEGMSEIVHALKVGNTLGPEYSYYALAQQRLAEVLKWGNEEFADIDIPLYPHQKEGAAFIFDRICNYGVALLGDSVGLGKTRTATLSIHYLLKKNAVSRVLILAPRKLHSQWRKELDGCGYFEDNKHVELESKDKFLRFNQREIEERTQKYDLIVIDEAHQGLRNFRAKSWQNLFSIPSKKGILITATPWNNSREDVYNLLTLFCNESAFDGRIFGKGDISKKRKLFSSEDSPYFKNVWFELVCQHTRRMINAELFPKRETFSQDIMYSKKALNYFTSLSNDLGNLNFPYFHLRRYFNTEKEYGELALSRHKMMIFKRASSSLFALDKTIKAIIDKTSQWIFSLAKVDNSSSLRALISNWTSSRVFSLDENDENDLLDSDNWVEKSFESINDDQAMSIKNKLQMHFEEDLLILKKLVKNIDLDFDKPKWDMFFEFVQKRRKKGKKTILISQFADTCLFFQEELKKRFDEEHKGIGLVTGMDSVDHKYSVHGSGVSAHGNSMAGKKEEVLCLFAPIGKDRKRYEELHGKIKYPELDILIGSDSISVGHNLQDADCIANIDLPYNPMVIEQRIGRIDRPKTEGAADIIDINYFYSAKIIELETRLKDILDRKLRQIYVDTQYDSDLLPHLSEEFYLALKEEQIEKSNEILVKIRDRSPFSFDLSQEDTSDEFKQALPYLKEALRYNLKLFTYPIVSINKSIESNTQASLDVKLTTISPQGKEISTKTIPLLFDGELKESLLEVAKSMKPNESVLKVKTFNDVTLFKNLDDHLMLLKDKYKIGQEQRYDEIIGYERQFDEKWIAPIRLEWSRIKNDSALAEAFIKKYNISENDEQLLNNWQEILDSPPGPKSNLGKLLRGLKEHPDLMFDEFQPILDALKAGHISKGVKRNIDIVDDVNIKIINLQVII